MRLRLLGPLAGGLVLCSVLAGGAAADDFKAKFDACSLKTDSAERLACYDFLAITDGPQQPDAKGGMPTDPVRVAPREDTGPPGAWRMTQDVSEIDDSPVVDLFLFSEDYVRPGALHYEPLLVITCREDRTTLYVSYEEFIGSGGATVKVRFDSEPAKSLRWQTANSGDAVGLWGGARSIPFIKSMYGHDKLTIRVTPYSASSRTATFDIAGVLEAVGPVAEACHWTP